MNLILCSVYDDKVGAFQRPFFVRSRGEALRVFMDACGDPESPLSKHLEDYKLFELGSFNEEDGSVIGNKSGAVCIGSALFLMNGTEDSNAEA